MKIIKNILYIAIIMMLLFVSCYNVSYAAPQTMQQDGAGGGSSDPIKNPEHYNPNGTMKDGDNDEFIEKANIILGIIRILGTVISVVSLMAIGIKYMFGSIEEKASFKETMVPYIIGAVMLFAIPNFLGVIFDLVESIKF